MIIPFTIQQANPGISEVRLDIIHGVSEKDTNNNTIIDQIVEIMYEYCSEEYGYGIVIKSYDDFCDKYWENHEFTIKDWYPVFRVDYFDNEWIEWDITKHKEQIYTSYVIKILNKTLKI